MMLLRYAALTYLCLNLNSHTMISLNQQEISDLNKIKDTLTTATLAAFTNDINTLQTVYGPTSVQHALEELEVKQATSGACLTEPTMYPTDVLRICMQSQNAPTDTSSSSTSPAISLSCTQETINNAKASILSDLSSDQRAKFESSIDPAYHARCAALKWIANEEKRLEQQHSDESDTQKGIHRFTTDAQYLDRRLQKPNLVRNYLNDLFEQDDATPSAQQCLPLVILTAEIGKRQERYKNHQHGHLLIQQLQRLHNALSNKITFNEKFLSSLKDVTPEAKDAFIIATAKQVLNNIQQSNL